MSVRRIERIPVRLVGLALVVLAVAEGADVPRGAIAFALVVAALVLVSGPVE